MMANLNYEQSRVRHHSYIYGHDGNPLPLQVGSGFTKTNPSASLMHESESRGRSRSSGLLNRHSDNHSHVDSHRPSTPTEVSWNGRSTSYANGLGGIVATGMWAPMPQDVNIRSRTQTIPASWGPSQSQSVMQTDYCAAPRSESPSQSQIQHHNHNRNHNVNVNVSQTYQPQPEEEPITATAPAPAPGIFLQEVSSYNSQNQRVSVPVSVNQQLQPRMQQVQSSKNSHIHTHTHTHSHGAQPLPVVQVPVLPYQKSAFTATATGQNGFSIAENHNHNPSFNVNEEQIGATSSVTADNVQQQQYAGGRHVQRERAGSSKGDWFCASCGNTNYAWRHVCNMRKCRAPKPGHLNVEPSPPGSWACLSCGNLNYAERNICNMRKCRAPRPTATTLSMHAPVHTPMKTTDVAVAVAANQVQISPQEQQVVPVQSQAQHLGNLPSSNGGFLLINSVNEHQVQGQVPQSQLLSRHNSSQSSRQGHHQNQHPKHQKKSMSRNSSHISKHSYRITRCSSMEQEKQNVSVRENNYNKVPGSIGSSCAA